MPPEYQDDNAASSPAEHTQNPDVSAESSTAEGASASSESPTDDTQADGGADESTLMDAITRAADGDDNADDADSEDSDKPTEDEEDDSEETDQSDADEDEGGEDTTDGKDEKPEPFHKHPRWKEMVRERDGYKDQVESLSPRAQEYDKITTFMDQNELSVQEVAEGLQVVAMMKNDPARAREVLAKRMENLDRFTGNRLPDDLQAEVDEGAITEDRARELASLRNQSEFQSERAERVQQRSQQQQQQEDARRAIEDQQSALRQWEADTQKSDPDYQRIQRFVVKELRLLVQQKPPRNREEAVGLAKSAYKTVKDELKAAMPSRPEVRRQPNSDQSAGSSASGRSPESFMDAVNQAANQS